jgi:hypothetical protein
LIVLFAAFAIINNHLPPSPGNAITFAEKKISSMMKDPDSVKFESSKFYQRGMLLAVYSLAMSAVM